MNGAIDLSGVSVLTQGASVLIQGGASLCSQSGISGWGVMVK